jgi:hypothetical protein
VAVPAFPNFNSGTSPVLLCRENTNVLSNNLGLHLVKICNLLYLLCSFVCFDLFEGGVTFCVICVFLLFLIVVPLPPGKNPFAVQLNKIIIIIIISS